jgi:hypothetical protein
MPHGGGLEYTQVVPYLYRPKTKKASAPEKNKFKAGHEAPLKNTRFKI